MMQKIKKWMLEKEKALTDKQKLILLISLYIILFMACAWLIKTTWGKIPFIM